MTERVEETRSDHSRASQAPAASMSEFIPPSLSRGQWSQSTHANEVVGAHCDESVQLCLRSTEEARLAQPCYRLQPSEGLLDQLALALREQVAAMANRTAIESRGAATCDRCDVRHDAPTAQRRDGVARVKALVASQRLQLPEASAVDPSLQRVALTGDDVVDLEVHD